MKILAYILAVIVSTGLIMTYSGYALSILWEWFVVPTLGLSPLSIPAAIGIAIVVSYLTHQMESSQSEGKSYIGALATGIVTGILRPTFALFFGWIVSWWM